MAIFKKHYVKAIEQMAQSHKGAASCQTFVDMVHFVCIQSTVRREFMDSDNLAVTLSCHCP